MIAAPVEEEFGKTLVEESADPLLNGTYLPFTAGESYIQLAQSGLATAMAIYTLVKPSEPSSLPEQALNNEEMIFDNRPFASKIVLSPIVLDYSIIEGEGSPSAQSFTIKNGGLTRSSLNYTATQDQYWIGLSGPIIPLATGESTRYTVSVNTSGFTAADSPYIGLITVSDPTSSNGSANIAVTVIVKPTPPPKPPSIPGTWTGTYSYPYDDLGDDATFNITWDLKRSGNAVSGTYKAVETDSLDPGNVTTGALVDGKINGEAFSIYDDGGFEYVGTLSGTTLSGTVITGALPGNFSVQRQ